MRKLQPINFRPSDQYVKQILNETYYGDFKDGNKVVLKLPCGCTSIQILRPGTIRPVCPICHRKYVLKWELLNKTIRQIA